MTLSISEQILTGLIGGILIGMPGSFYFWHRYWYLVYLDTPEEHKYTVPLFPKQVVFFISVFVVLLTLFCIIASFEYKTLNLSPVFAAAIAWGVCCLFNERWLITLPRPLPPPPEDNLSDVAKEILYRELTKKPESQ